MSNDEEDVPEVYPLGKTYLAGEQVEFHIRDDAIVHMAAGDRHTIVVTESGRAFAFGDNSSGQLGLGHTNNVDRVSCIRSLKFGDTSQKVILAACGRESSLVATNQGSLYSFGSNSHCQLALESKDERSIHSEPVKITTVPQKRSWKQIAMGAEHACALTSTGEVYVWGSNEDGQCGQDEEHQTIRRPQELRINAPVKAIACGYYHTALVSEDGRLFLCGNNADRQFGRSKPSGHYDPVQVSMPDRVKAVACGNQHTLVLTEDGNVYTCGRGDRGQLGFGLQMQTAESFELLDCLPKKRRATDIAAGETHSAVLDDKDNLYLFGDGKHGKLGFATHSNEFKPCVVDRFQFCTVLKVVCGGCQTIVLARNRWPTEREALVNEDDEKNKTMSITLQTKSTARLKRLDTLPDRSRSSLDRTVQPARPVEIFNSALKTEHDSDSDENDSDPEMSASMRSDLFKTTHATINGRLQPTHTSLRQSTRQNAQDDLKPLRTGALDRTARLDTHVDERRLQNREPPPTKRSPVRSSPEEELSNEDSSEAESSSSTETPERRKPREPTPVLPPKQDNRRPFPKRSESDDEDDRKRYTPEKKTTPRVSVTKPSTSSESSSEEETDVRRRTDHRRPLPKQTVRPTDDTHTATTTTINSGQDPAMNETQPRFFSRFFAPKLTPPTVTQSSSKTCAVM